VFDEIDVGVGGRTASAIADKMATLAGSAQVICITHLAQLASRGASHFYIEKNVVGDRTVTTVTPLTEEERVEEIARMLGGQSESALAHARTLLG